MLKNGDEFNLFCLGPEIDIADDALHDLIGRTTHHLNRIKKYLIATGEQSQQALTRDQQVSKGDELIGCSGEELEEEVCESCDELSAWVMCGKQRGYFR